MADLVVAELAVVALVATGAGLGSASAAVELEPHRRHQVGSLLEGSQAVASWSGGARWRRIA